MYNSFVYFNLELIWASLGSLSKGQCKSDNKQNQIEQN